MRQLQFEILGQASGTHEHVTSRYNQGKIQLGLCDVFG